MDSNSHRDKTLLAMVLKLILKMGMGRKQTPETGEKTIQRKLRKITFSNDF